MCGLFASQGLDELVSAAIRRQYYGGHVLMLHSHCSHSMCSVSGFFDVVERMQKEGHCIDVIAIYM